MNNPDFKKKNAMSLIAILITPWLSDLDLKRFQPFHQTIVFYL